MVVRLSKHLVSMYYEDFYSALRMRVGRLAFAEERSAASLAGQEKWARMAQLYGEDAIPERLLQCLNNGLDSWTHTVSAPAPGEAAVPAPSVRALLLEVLRRRLLVADEHPTLTRFFTFRLHIQALLLLSFLGIAPDVLSLSTTKPLEKTSKRLRSVLAFLALPGTQQYLSRTSLVLNLLDHAHRLCAQLHKPGEPLLVRLAKGQILETWDADVSLLLQRLHLDPQLDVGPLLTLVMLVSIDAVERFRHYEAYPFKCFQCVAPITSGGVSAACSSWPLPPKN